MSQSSQLPPQTSLAMPPDANTSPHRVNVAIFGSTGATGSFLLHKLLRSPSTTTVYSFVRRTNVYPALLNNPKYVEIQIPPTVEEFTEESLTALWPNVNDSPVAINSIFTTLGSTAKQSGSNDAFIAIDYGMNSTIAVVGKARGVSQFFLMSSIGADASASNVYLQTKGRLENRVMELNFDRTFIFRPGVLDNTDRPSQPSRPAECCAVFVMKFMCCCFLPNCFSKWRPIDVHQIACVMVELFQNHIAQQPAEPVIYNGSQEIRDLAKVFGLDGDLEETHPVS